MSKTEKTEKCLYVMLTSQGRLGLQGFFLEQTLNSERNFKRCSLHFKNAKLLPFTIGTGLFWKGIKKIRKICRIHAR